MYSTLGLAFVGGEGHASCVRYCDSLGRHAFDRRTDGIVQVEVLSVVESHVEVAREAVSQGRCVGIDVEMPNWAFARFNFRDPFYRGFGALLVAP